MENLDALRALTLALTPGQCRKAHNIALAEKGRAATRGIVFDGTDSMMWAWLRMPRRGATVSMDRGVRQLVWSYLTTLESEATPLRGLSDLIRTGRV